MAFEQLTEVYLGWISRSFSTDTWPAAGADFMVPHSKYGGSQSSWVSKFVLNIKQARRRRQIFFTKYLKYPNFGVFNLFSLI